MRLSLVIVTATAHLAFGADSGIALRGINLPEEAPDVGDGTSSGIALRGINLPEEVPDVGDGTSSETEWGRVKKVIKKPKGTWPCWTWGCHSDKYCSTDGRCKTKKSMCSGTCKRSSDCKSGYCNWKFQCSEKGQKFNNGCKCALDRDCKSGRCADNFKCMEKSGLGGYCSVISKKNECKAGLSCGGLVNGKCYHEARRVGEPCNVANNKCANKNFCLPSANPKALSVGTQCAPFNTCLVKEMGKRITNMEKLLEDWKSLWDRAAKGFRSVDSIEKFARGPENRAMMEALDKNILKSFASQVTDSAKMCGYNLESENESFGLSEELSGSGPVVSLGIELDAGAGIKASVQIGIAISSQGVRCFYSIMANVSLGAEASVGLFVNLLFGGGLESKVGKSGQVLGVDVGPVVDGLIDGGVSFGHTLDDDWRAGYDPIFDVTVTLGAGAGFTADLMGFCKTFWLW